MKIKLKNKLLVSIIIVAIFTFLPLKCNYIIGKVYADVEPGTKIIIPPASQYPQSSDIYELDYDSFAWGNGTLQKRLHEAWQAAGSHYDKETGICMMPAGKANWALVAVSETFGIVGDYLKVHVNHDGVETDYPMIICDIKNPSDDRAYMINGIHYGHTCGPSLKLLNILEFMIKGQKIGTWHQFEDCEYIINGGSYFDNPDGSVNFDVTSVFGSTGFSGQKQGFFETIGELFRNFESGLCASFDNLISKREDVTVMYRFREQEEYISAGDYKYKGGKYPFPLKNADAAQVTSPYGWRLLNGETKYHHGVDLSGIHHDEVISIENGKVYWAGVQSGYGNCIGIEHKSGGKKFYSFYAHLSKILVKEGQVVKQGQTIGIEGGDASDPHSEGSYGHHLHFEIRTEPSSCTYAIDPSPYILSK